MWPILLLVTICVCAENRVNQPIEFDWFSYKDHPSQPLEQSSRISNTPQYGGYNSVQDIEHQNVQGQMETVDEPSNVPMDATVSSICENKSKKILAVWEVISERLGISGDRKVPDLVEVKRLSMIFKTFLTISRDKDFNKMSIREVLNTIQKRLNDDDLGREGVDIPEIDGRMKPEDLAQDSSIEGVNGEENELNYVLNVGIEEEAPKGNLNLLQMFAREPSKIDPKSTVLTPASIFHSYEKIILSNNMGDTDSENNAADESIIGSIDERDFEKDAEIPYIASNKNRGSFLNGELSSNKVSKVSSFASPTGSEPDEYSVANEAAHLQSPIMSDKNALLIDYSSPTTNTEDNSELDVNSLKTLADNSGIPIPDWPIEFEKQSESMNDVPIARTEDIKAPFMLTDNSVLPDWPIEFEKQSESMNDVPIARTEDIKAPSVFTDNSGIPLPDWPIEFQKKSESINDVPIARAGDIKDPSVLTDNSGIPDWPIELEKQSEAMNDVPIVRTEDIAPTVFPIDNIVGSRSKEPEIIGLTTEQTTLRKEVRPSLPTSDTSKQLLLHDEANAFIGQITNEQKQNDRSLLTPSISPIEKPFDEAVLRTSVEPYIKESGVNIVHDYNPEYSARIVNRIASEDAAVNTEFAPDDVTFGNELNFASTSDSYTKFEPIEEETITLGAGYNHNSNAPTINDEYSLEPIVTPINEVNVESQSFLDKDSIPVDYDYISWTSLDDDIRFRNDQHFEKENINKIPLRDTPSESTSIWQPIISHYARNASCTNSKIVSLLVELKALLDALGSVCE